MAALEALTYVLFGLFAGVLADRAQRWRIMVLADCANAVLIGSVPVAGALHQLTAAHGLVVAGLSGVATVFFDAADFAALPLLVGTDRLTTVARPVAGEVRYLVGVLRVGDRRVPRLGDLPAPPGGDVRRLALDGLEC